VGNFDLVVSASAVHHLDGAGKADLFARIAARLRSGARFVLGDVVVPDDPADVVTLIDGVRPAEHGRRPGPMACRRRLQRRRGLGTPGPLRDRRRFAVLMPPSGDDRWCARRLEGCLTEPSSRGGTARESAYVAVFRWTG
jgi:SAM-dependent methyltransferase